MNQYLLEAWQKLHDLPDQMFQLFKLHVDDPAAVGLFEEHRTAGRKLVLLLYADRLECDELVDLSAELVQPAVEPSPSHPPCCHQWHHYGYVNGRKYLACQLCGLEHYE